MGELLIRQTFSQRDWPGAGDIDDCWVLSALQLVNAVAPWSTLYTVPEFRRFAGDPDDGNADGGNVDEIIRGIRAAYPELADGFAPLRGSWSWERVLDSIKSGRPASVCVVSSKLPDRYGFTGLHQVTYFHDPGVGLYVANPLARDRSVPTRIPTIAARDAALAYGNGKIFAVLAPTVATAFRSHPLYKPPGVCSPADLEAAARRAREPYIARLAQIEDMAAAPVT